jgi:hypothetical protein
MPLALREPWSVTNPANGCTATASFSLRVDVNNDGQVIGYSESAPAVFSSFLFLIQPVFFFSKGRKTSW